MTDGGLQQAQDETQQDAMQNVKPQKAVRKSEAHQRLKESNRQRRSLAGALPDFMSVLE